ncbi:uncharacterized protein LOC124697500 [Lolium rigidum]|uniref:uncharacterized protein LOC124697500 n=1 Tax=Lolium rigidum TaxID=89674 RepID=UPI001F5DE3A4|nr:uncharacterized protein LOC124697500 [Lolium rigidum]
MEYEFSSRSGSGSYVSGGAGGGGSSLYPRVSQLSHGAAAAPQRAAPYQHVTASPSSPASPAPAPSSSSSSAPLGIKAVIKPEYRITPPPRLAPQMVEVPRSTFNFDFEYERMILAEAEKENPNWGKFVAERQTPPTQQQPQPPGGPRHTTSTTSMAASVDPVVEKYISMGLGRQAVSFAVLNYGDNPTKVKEFVKSYNALHEMGFTSPKVPELLAIHDNDLYKVIQQL